MTAEEIARKTALNWWGDDSYPHKADFESLIQEFTKAIEQAKAEEREAAKAEIGRLRGIIKKMRLTEWRKGYFHGKRNRQQEDSEFLRSVTEVGGEI